MTEIRPGQVENCIAIVSKAQNQSNKKNVLDGTLDINHSKGVIRIKLTSWKSELLSSNTCIATNWTTQMPSLYALFLQEQTALSPSNSTCVTKRY